jgi:hypothetical protein
MIPIYIAFLWHMHQPMYWPGEDVMETEAAAHYGFSVLTVHLDRTGPYTAWPMDAVAQAMDGGLGSCGAQVSFTGSLMENLDAISGAGAGFSGWPDNWIDAASWRTGLGNPRIDMVGMGYFHPIMPLVDGEDAALQIELHRLGLETFMPGTVRSRGLFPPETGFAPWIIPALEDAGVEWVIVDNLHFDRTLADYPYRPEGNLFPPNRADQVSEAPVTWVNLSGLWAPTPVSAPWGYRPHRARYVDPETGAASEVIVVPAARYEGNEDARGGFGALNYDAVLSQLQAYNTDPDHPILVVLHHDGDNYGGGTDSYYHSNFANLVSWLQANSDRFVCTTIQDYLDTFPPASDDVIHVEPGSWSGADNGDPEFAKWNGDPGTDGYSPDRNSWAVVTAARNRTAHAAALEPYGSPGDVRTGTGNASARAMRWLLLAETSCYWYWDGAEGGIWDSHPTRAANRAFEEADAVIEAHAGEDPVGPTIYAPQREPYNPGELEWGTEPMASDFEVWTFIYDVSGVSDAVLRYRLDDDGVLDHANALFDAGGWCDIPMEETSPSPQTDPLPLHQASQYSARITGVRGAFVDYYVVCRDGVGNVSHSAVSHTWVGSDGGPGPEGLLYYPLDPTLHDEITVLSAREADLHWGINSWNRPPEVYWPAGTADFGDGHAVETPMIDADGDTMFEAVVGPFNDPSETVEELDFIFHYPDGSWSGTDIRVSVDNAPGDSPHVFLVSPQEGETVEGMVRILATASDNGALSSVSILVDGAGLADLASPPFTALWDTDAAGDGDHTVRVEALDGDGNLGHDEASVTVGGSSATECVIGTDASTDPFTDPADAVDVAPDGEDMPLDLEDGEGDPAAADADGVTDTSLDLPGEEDGDHGGDGCGCAMAR